MCHSAPQDLGLGTWDLGLRTTYLVHRGRDAAGVVRVVARVDGVRPGAAVVVRGAAEAALEAGARRVRGWRGPHRLVRVHGAPVPAGFERVDGQRVEVELLAGSHGVPPC